MSSALEIFPENFQIFTKFPIGKIKSYFSGKIPILSLCPFGPSLVAPNFNYTVLLFGSLGRLLPWSRGFAPPHEGVPLHENILVWGDSPLLNGVRTLRPMVGPIFESDLTTLR